MKVSIVSLQFKVYNDVHLILRELGRIKCDILLYFRFNRMSAFSLRVKLLCCIKVMKGFSLETTLVTCVNKCRRQLGKIFPQLK